MAAAAGGGGGGLAEGGVDGCGGGGAAGGAGVAVVAEVEEGRAAGETIRGARRHADARRVRGGVEVEFRRRHHHFHLVFPSAVSAVVVVSSPLVLSVCWLCLSLFKVGRRDDVVFAFL